MEEIREQIIIGSGPAGLTAAIYSARANLKPLLIAGVSFGGQLMTTSDVENFPGFSKGIQGPALMQEMLEQAKRFGTEVVFKDATKVDFSDKIKKVFVGETMYQARSVILATGSSPKMLGIESEKKLWGKGVSSCATCDGAFYKNKIVSVVGGGDSAMEEATFLTRFATKVYLVHRRDDFKASQIMLDRAKQNDKIEFVTNSEIKEILGESNVTGLRLFNNKENKDTDLTVDGLFLGIGHTPSTKFLEGQIELDEMGYIVVKGDTHTNVEGVFVAGDVRDHRYQQAVTAAGMGCMASIDAEEYLEMLDMGNN